MRVRVRQTIKQFGWYGGKRRYPGDEFDIAGVHELGSWMEPVFSESEKLAEVLPVVTHEVAPEAVQQQPIKRTRRTKAQMLADRNKSQ